MFRSTGNIGKLRASRERATAVDVGRVSPNPVAIVKVKKIDSLRPIQRRMDHRNGHFIASRCNKAARSHPAPERVDSLNKKCQPPKVD